MLSFCQPHTPLTRPSIEKLQTPFGSGIRCYSSGNLGSPFNGHHARPGRWWSRWSDLVLRLDLFRLFIHHCLASRNGVYGSVCYVPCPSKLPLLNPGEELLEDSTIGFPNSPRLLSRSLSATLSVCFGPTAVYAFIC